MIWRVLLAAVVLTGSPACASPKDDADAAVAARVALDRAYEQKDEKALSAAVERIRALADRHDPRGLYELGRCYAHNIGVLMDLDQAVKYYLEAAKLGDPGGQYEVANLYAEGLGTNHRLREALSWYETVGLREDGARAQKFAADAAFDLAVLYEEGEPGLLKDETASLKWLRRAVALGQSNAQLHMAQRLLEGRGVARDHAAAIPLLSAASRDHGEACFLLGDCYERGDGVKQDLERAKELFIKADELYEVRALYRVALLVDRQDPKGAIAWYVRAFKEGGNNEAALALGRHYRDGVGVARDLVEAYAWTGQAANPEYTPQYIELRAKLSAAEIARGEERIKAIGRNEVTDPELLKVTKDVPWPDEAPKKH